MRSECGRVVTVQEGAESAFPPAGGAAGAWPQGKAKSSSRCSQTLPQNSLALEAADYASPFGAESMAADRCTIHEFIGADDYHCKHKLLWQTNPSKNLPRKGSPRLHMLAGGSLALKEPDCEKG